MENKNPGLRAHQKTVNRELVVLAPRDDAEQAEAFAKAAGARIAALGTLADIPAVLNQLMAR